MSDEHEYATLAADLLRERKAEARTRGVDRLQGISVVTRAMAKRDRRKAQMRVLTVGAALVAAAGIALIAGWYGARAPGRSASGVCTAPSCVGATAPAEFGMVAGRPFEPGQSIAAGRGRATVVEFGPVTRITLDELSELEYRQGDRTRRFALLSGAVHLKVEKLSAGQRFLVETVDTQVEVRGTVFDVALTGPDDCASPKTRVSVEEGVVDVRFKGKLTRVHAGQSWPASCEEPVTEPAHTPEARAKSASAPPRAAVAPGAAKPAEPAANTTSSRSDAAAGKPAETAPSSSLAEQNNLYAEAAALHRAGRFGDALSAYERLLARFPNGPLAESASVGRLRILAKSERARAKDEARRYLSRYPHGIASAEAQALLEP